VVRLEVEESISPEVLELLTGELGIEEREVYRVPGPLDLTAMHEIADLDRPELRYPPFVPSKTALPRDSDVFSVLEERDILVHHPYDSFTTSVQQLIEAAAEDPQVLAIKQTLYRTSGNSPIVDALIDAAEAGKQVVVVVELKARFDEHANITWARKLEEAGCHVVYGFVGLKTHCKLAMVVRQESDGTLRRYCHIGTGNYNPKTARTYEDFGLLTSDPEVAEDVNDLFNHLTGHSRQIPYRQLLVAPRMLRSGLVLRIEREAEHHRAGRPAHIRFKCNSLVDEEVIDALYRASQAGVPIDIWVRGICALRPGVPGLSETIRVRSVLGRFLEHSRVYVFDSGGDPEVWIGSADLMHRNLDRRVEALVRVRDRQHRDHLIGLLDRVMDESTASWELDGDGSWTRRTSEGDEDLSDIQTGLMRSRR
jgi:polyphosphate kinase